MAHGDLQAFYVREQKQMKEQTVARDHISSSLNLQSMSIPEDADNL